MFRAAQTRSLDRHLLPVHHAVTGFFSPAVSTPRGMLLMPLPGQVPHFFLHHQAHQRQPGLAYQVAHAFLQQTHDLGHRKNHLKVGILFAGQLPEFLHRSLLVDLVSFLHSDSLLFLGRKNHPRPIMTADVRVATFYELTGILLQRFRHGIFAPTSTTATTRATRSPSSAPIVTSTPRMPRPIVYALELLRSQAMETSSRFRELRRLTRWRGTLIKKGLLGVASLRNCGHNRNSRDMEVSRGQSLPRFDCEIANRDLLIFTNSQPVRRAKCPSSI